ncbi:MAG TPA: multiheme c-type cytochrome, partial [Gemmata sp.]
MNLSARTVLVTLAAAVLGIAVAVGAARVTKPDTVVVPGPVTPGGGGAGQKAEDRAVGMAGCMAAACHGAPATKALSGDRGADCWQSSGSCWAAADPHTAAYSLLTERPQRPVTVTAADIMAKYRPGTKATDDARCLACHTNPALAEKAPTPEVVALREQGVSCEACHGNAGRWLQPHTAWTGDRTKPYQDHGLRRLFD